MSTLTVSTQNSTHFDLTQKIWNEAWHAEDGCSLKSLGAKVACIVFPILLSVLLADRAQAIVKHLFILSQEKPELFFVFEGIIQIALLKIGNNQTISVVCANAEAIFFNSHKNEKTMTTGQEATLAYLMEMLEANPLVQDGVVHPFSYALGRCDTTK